MVRVGESATAVTVAMTVATGVLLACCRRSIFLGQYRRFIRFPSYSKSEIIM